MSSLLGYSLMVEQRTLTPYIQVRVLVAQPLENPPFRTFFIGFHSVGLDINE